jgi:opacity protein-like surface antigen
MKRFALAFAVAPLALASAAVAQATLPDVPDTDGNGTWSLVELQAVWTDLTEEAFTGIDTSADGAVDAAELQAALDNGLITAPADSGN